MREHIVEVVHILKVYANIALQLTWRLQSWYKGNCTASAHKHNLWQTAQCESHLVRVGTSSRYLPAWLTSDLKKKYANSNVLTMKMIGIIQIIAPFQHERTNVYSIGYFGLLIRFAHFMIMVGEVLPRLPSLTARHWFFIIQDFEQLVLALKKRVCPEIFHCIEYIF